MPYAMAKIVTVVIFTKYGIFNFIISFKAVIADAITINNPIAIIKNDCKPTERKKFNPS